VSLWGILFGGTPNSTREDAYAPQSCAERWEKIHATIILAVSFRSERALAIRGANFSKDIGDPNRLHAKIIAAGGLAIIERIDAGTARDSGVENPRAWRARAKKLGALRTKQSHDSNRRERGKMSRAAVVGYEHARERIEHEQLPQRRLPRQREAARTTNLVDQPAAARSFTRQSSKGDLDFRKLL
jgi:hypothetical protein